MEVSNRTACGIVSKRSRGIDKTVSRVDNTGDKILDRFKRKLKSHNETDYVYKLLHHGLWTARERLENEELDSKRSCDMTRRTLTGIELEKLNAADEERQQRFRKKRDRIIEQKNNLMQWTS